MARPREHGPEARAKLLAAAARILGEEGVEALSVRRLSDEVGVSPRAIYSLFGGMPGVIAALFRHGVEAMVTLHERVRRRPDARAEIIALALAYRQGALEQRDLYGLMFERAVPSFRPDEAEITYAMRSLGRVQQAVERAVVQYGSSRDPGQTARQLWAVVHGLASLELRGVFGPPAHAEAVWRDTIAAVLAGLFPTA